MKVRILGNTIRLRVKMHETDAICTTGMIEEVLEFGPSEENKLRFQILTGENSFEIHQQDLTIQIVVPGTLVEKWASTDLVGFEESVTTSKGSVIKVLIEKDFACLDGDREDEVGSYPNPIEEPNC